MNSERLRRHYPELHELPEETQRTLIEKAQAQTFGQAKKLHNWRKNMVTLAVIASLSLFLVIVVGPALGLSDGAVAGVMMVLVLPAFMIIQFRRYIEQLRPAISDQVAQYKQKKAP